MMAEPDELDVPDLLALARAWIHQDPDPETRAELEALVEARALDELRARMSRLEFGTAGLRALEGAGPGRMNLAVVIRTTRGLAEHLHRTQPEVTVHPVVVGYDARRNSRRYAEAAIAVLVAARINVRYFEAPVPTPLVAYAAREYGAQAAICVTASHNPKEYAGFKVYADNAVQITSPADRQIAAAVEQVAGAAQVPLAGWHEAPLDGPGARPVDAGLIDRYLSDLLALRPVAPAVSPLRIVLTPLHGVGGAYLHTLLKRAGYPALHPVVEQFEPDPDFPSVAFPNPEEPGALDAALCLARKVEADLVLANDPDADRLAVCVREPKSSRAAADYRTLTGNQLGALLGDYVLRHQSVAGRSLVVSSIVSSPMFQSIAKAHGAHPIRTLTGFKWMLNAALALERDLGLRFVYGFEEALGYCIGGPVRDKDGISAGLFFADLMTEAAAAGQSVSDLLYQLYRMHGLWTSALFTLHFEQSVEAVALAGQRVRALAAKPPEELDGLEVREVLDYTENVSERPWYLGFADLVEIRLQGGARTLVRPSGTEPKLKIYADFRDDFDSARTAPEQERAAEQRAQRLAGATAAYLEKL